MTPSGAWFDGTVQMKIMEVSFFKPRNFILAAPLALLLGSVSSAQTACSFGSVTPSDYRRMSEHAESLSTQRTLPRSESEVADELSQRFRTISEGNKSAYVQIAAMHAVLRSIGAEYRNTISAEDPYGSAVAKNGLVIFNYAVRASKLAAVFGEARISGVLPVRAYRSLTKGAAARTPVGTVSFAVVVPSLVDNPGEQIKMNPDGATCPPVPTPDQSSAF
jgi:hypothetical protein